jgi:Right handed beta helix region
MKIIAALAVGLALASTLSIPPARAQATRTFVSPTGNDAAGCSLAAPCRTLAAAYALTNAGGEIAVLGTAGYGPLTISKAISIVNGGGFEAGVSVASGGTGITINAGPNDAVSLRGLTIDGAGVGNFGIQFNTGASLTLENLVIRHMFNIGIWFTSATPTSLLTVSNSLVADNGGAGIAVLSQGSVTAVFNRLEVTNNKNSGISVDGTLGGAANKVAATATDCLAAGNTGVGFIAQSALNGAPTRFMVVHSVAVSNATGVGATAATLRLANSTVTENAAGWAVNTGVVATYGDNYIDDNGSNTGSLTAIPKQ